ncbi:Heavy metal transporter [Candidatus Defluviicoccus seviourii]|uniref:Heavy metal transporter n=2 Tax=root TaxID=1 RepID=A0A564WGN4_9PROT|nr:Heavy metal transporter [uncultured Defluviicoccus sp.]VUX47481.1 Heavy metal transporter [Candidatus Defluviicoccus seviourii]
MTTIYRVDGMTCQGCARAVTNAIKEAVPDADVAIDLAGGRVTVAGPADEARIRAAIEAAGFEYRGTAPAA